MTKPPQTGDTKAGVAMTTLSFLMWGASIVYWKALADVNPVEVLGWRIISSMIFTALLLSLRKGWRQIGLAVTTGPGIRRLALSAALLAANWFTFLWAVSHDLLIDASLGYFINPLLFVLLGRLFLKERLRRWQIVSLALAGATMIFVIAGWERFPWVALVLAATFAFYAMLRKTSRMESTAGLAAETAVLAPPALALLLLLGCTGKLTFPHGDSPTRLLLIASGLTTCLPLLCFTYGARRAKLSTVGFLQYISPTCLFIFGVVVYVEPIKLAQLITFPLIWAALAIYSWDSLAANRKR